MKKQLAIWQFILKCFQQNTSVLLMYVLDSKGSSPGRQGFAMAVAASGEMEGSIGGGVMEHKFVELAKEKLKSGSGELTVRKQIHDKAAAKNQSGMICSGEQTILLYAMQQENAVIVQAIIESLLHNKNGRLTLSPKGLSFDGSIVPKQDFYYRFDSEGNWWYEEKLGFKNHLFIIGAGHCALAFSKLMNEMDFCVHIFDDRKELNTFDQNNFVHQKTLVAEYSELKELIPAGTHHYVVIMTFGYRTDDIALRALLHKEFAFLGLLGSAAKIDKMFATYRHEGFEQKLLQNIHAPVGLPINSQTPEEIAVSIAAQIIQVKNQKHPGSEQVSASSETLYSGKL